MQVANEELKIPVGTEELMFGGNQKAMISRKKYRIRQGSLVGILNMPKVTHRLF